MKNIVILHPVFYLANKNVPVIFRPELAIYLSPFYCLLCKRMYVLVKELQSLALNVQLVESDILTDQAEEEPVAQDENINNEPKH